MRDRSAGQGPGTSARDAVDFDFLRTGSAAGRGDEKFPQAVDGRRKPDGRTFRVSRDGYADKKAILVDDNAATAAGAEGAIKLKEFVFVYYAMAGDDAFLDAALESEYV